MTYAKAIVISAVLVASAIVYATHRPAFSAFGVSNGLSARYQVAIDAHRRLMIVDKQTGQVRNCYPMLYYVPP